MSDIVTIDPAVLSSVAGMKIADLVESTPDVMAVLAPFGIDLCCGGGRQLGEALALHGVDAEPVLRQVALLADPSLAK